MTYADRGSANSSCVSQLGRWYQAWSSLIMLQAFVSDMSSVKDLLITVLRPLGASPRIMHLACLVRIASQIDLSGCLAQPDATKQN